LFKIRKQYFIDPGRDEIEAGCQKRSDDKVAGNFVGKNTPRDGFQAIPIHS
jgi:hypothetical protein